MRPVHPVTMQRHARAIAECAAEKGQSVADTLARMFEADDVKDACLDVADEVHRTRAKFPGNRLMLAALMEEVGELARALLQNEGQERVRAEALQVAATAVRIMEEGDATFLRHPAPDREGSDGR